MSDRTMDGHAGPCGATWQADYGPLPCDKGAGHEGMHRTYGSQGPIEWKELGTTLTAKDLRDFSSFVDGYQNEWRAGEWGWETMLLTRVLAFLRSSNPTPHAD